MSYASLYVELPYLACSAKACENSFFMLIQFRWVRMGPKVKRIKVTPQTRIHFSPRWYMSGTDKEHKVMPEPSRQMHALMSTNAFPIQ